MPFIFLIKRYLILLSLSAIVGFGLGYGYLFLKGDSQVHKGNLYLILAVEDRNFSASENELAANHFGETIIGWFRNPAFQREIIGDKAGVSISSYKQERQNLVVEVISSDQKTTEEVLRNSFLVLFKNVSNYNDNSDAKYTLIDQGQTFTSSSSKNVAYPFIGLLFFLILAFGIIAIYEFLNGVISSIEQAEEVVGSKAIDIIDSDFEKNDYTLLSVAIQKMQPVVIFAGLNFDIENLSVALAQRQSFFGEKLLLVDGDLQKRSLQNALGLSSRLKNLKGLTNISEDFIREMRIKDVPQIGQDSPLLMKRDESNLFLQNTLDDNLKFIPAGTGNGFLIEIFHNLSHQMRTLVHTQLPENAEILRLSKATLVLVVKLGKSKLSDLKKIKQVWGDDIKLVLIK